MARSGELGETILLFKRLKLIGKRDGTRHAPLNDYSVTLCPQHGYFGAGLQPIWLALITCVFTVGPKPQPCVKVLWLVPAVRVQVMGQPVIIQTSVGLCQSAEQIPQGPPNVIVAQTRAIAT